MPGTVTIKLYDPIIGHEGPVESLEIREPKARDRWQIGDLTAWSRTAEGGMIAIERDELYIDYLRRCLVKPVDADVVLAQLSMADALQVEKVFDDFFADARRKGSPPTPSSSS